MKMPMSAWPSRTCLSTSALTPSTSDTSIFGCGQEGRQQLSMAERRAEHLLQRLDPATDGRQGEPDDIAGRSQRPRLRHGAKHAQVIQGPLLCHLHRITSSNAPAGRAGAEAPYAQSSSRWMMCPRNSPSGFRLGRMSILHISEHIAHPGYVRRVARDSKFAQRWQ